ncbi:MAG: DUF1697 domain-containing protein [Pseudomonadota bacterium]
MTRYVAFLRAVNVGGTGKLPMADLRALCATIGFADVRTYIASGNLVFEWPSRADTAKTALESALAAYAGKLVGVVIRDRAAMEQIIADNPFLAEEPRFVHTIFLDDPPPPDALAHVTGLAEERIALGRCEIYVHYAQGQGASKLKIPAAATGTARNQNTVSKMAAWLREETS